MSKLIAPKGQTEFERQLIPVGLQEVVCYSVVDMGSQSITWDGETKQQRKVNITFESKVMWKFIDKDTEEEVEKPLVIWNRYTLSMHEKSGLHKMVKSWIGKTPEDDFNILDLVGKPAIVNVVETEWKDGKIYHNIDSVLPSKEKAFKLFNPEVKFSLQDYSETEFDKIPKWLQEKIQDSPEYAIALTDNTIPF